MFWKDCSLLHDYHMETSNSLEAMVSKVMYKYLAYGTVPWMKRVAMHTAVVSKASMYYINIATGSSGLLGTPGLSAYFVISDQNNTK